jgi:hypothetical protein
MMGWMENKWIWIKILRRVMMACHLRELFGYQSCHFPTGGKAEHVLGKEKKKRFFFKKKKTRGGMKPLKSRTPGR